jgi:ABC-type multidrug transport system fused ATPase/permease subunit
MNLLSINTIFNSIGTTARYNFIKATIILLIAGLLEGVSFGLVFPVLKIINGDIPDFIRSMPFVAKYILAVPQAQLLISAAILLLVVYSLKSAYLLYATRKQADYIFSTQSILSSKMLKVYLGQNYEFFVANNSSSLTRNILSEVDQFCHTTLVASSILLSEIIVIFAIGTALFILNPLAIVVITVVFVFGGYVYNAILKNKNKEYGNYRQKAEGDRLKTVQQIFESIKTVLLNQDTNYWYRRYSENVKVVSTMCSNQYYLVATPRIVTDLLAIITLVMITVILIVVQHLSLKEAIPILIVYGGASFRLMPSMTRVSSSIQSLYFTLPVINLIAYELRRPVNSHTDINHKNRVFLKDGISIENVSYTTQTGKEILKNITIKIPVNSHIGITGKSGAGKTTLIDMVAGLLVPTSGIIKIDGIDLKEISSSWSKSIGYVMQNTPILNDSVRSNIAFGVDVSQIDESRVSDAIRMAGLSEFVSLLPNGVDTLISERGGSISGGQRQRIGIARALYTKPQLLILDEGSSALDLETEEELLKNINDLEGLTTLTIAHRESALKNCTILIHIEDGNVNIKY